MGQLKFRPDAAKASGRYPAVVLGDPKPIAQRFAHSADLRQAALRRDDPPRASQPAQPPAAARGATASAGGRLAVRTRLLIAGLILAALVPSLILVALWLGLIGMPGSKPAVAVPAPQTAAPSAVLTFSEGRPYGGSEWNLKPDQIGDLALVLPADANGEFKLGIALIGPDDRVIAEAVTLLAIAPAPAPSEPAAAEAGSVPSPEVSEPAATAAFPDGNEPAASAPVPDVGPGDGAEMEQAPTAMEATAPSVEAPSGKVEPTMEKATAPSGDTPPDTAEPTEDDRGGLGTVEPSVFVNLREAPSSSAPVLGVIAKGAKLSVLDRKRGWVQVTDPETGKKGWIYSGLLAGEAKTHHRIRRVAPAEAEPKSESFWSRLGGWLSP